MKCERCGELGEFVVAEALVDDNAYTTALCTYHLQYFFQIRSNVLPENLAGLAIVRVSEPD